MGEIADMMLDGRLCGGCGMHLYDEAPGYPIYCGDCFDEDEGLPNRDIREKTMEACVECDRWFAKGKPGLADHKRDVHGVTA